MKDFRKKNNTYSRPKEKQNIFAIILLLLLIILFSAGCSSANNDTSTEETSELTIAVSVAPQKSIVESIAGDKAKIITMIPQGYSPENYQPKPSSLEDLSKANVYFTVDVPTESANILPALKDLNTNIKIVDLFDAVAEEHRVLSFDLYNELVIADDRDHDEDEDHDEDGHEAEDNHDHDGLDPHIWLSPKRVKLMAKHVLDELIISDKENADFYTANYNDFILSLDELDKYIETSLSEYENKSFIIYHPSLGYYADDYNLNMIAIEENGKAATAKSLEKVIEYSKAKDIGVIFYQSEIDSSQVKVIASEINGQVIEINPLSENLIENLYEMTDVLKNNLN